MKQKLKSILQKLKEHKISLGKASEELGISLQETLKLAKQRDINWTGYSTKDLEKDSEILVK